MCERKKITIQSEVNSTGRRKRDHVSIIWGAGKTITTSASTVYINPADAKQFPILHGLLFILMLGKTAEAILLWVI